MKGSWRHAKKFPICSEVLSKHHFKNVRDLKEWDAKKEILSETMEAGVKERPQERGGERTGEELTERPQGNKDSTADDATHAESIHRPS